MAAKEDEVISYTSESIGQIREIIFGEREKEFESRLHELKSECEQLHNRLTALEAQQQHTQHTVSEDCVRLQNYESGQQELRAWIEHVQKELERKIEKLASHKVDKSQIGQAFIEWGMKVKQEANPKRQK